MRFISASRLSAAERDTARSFRATRAGSRDATYREPLPAKCAFRRFPKSFVTPVYSEPSPQRKM